MSPTPRRKPQDKDNKEGAVSATTTEPEAAEPEAAEEETLDFLDQKVKEIRERMDEIRPLVDEFRRLEAADRALAPENPAPRRPGRPRKG